MKSDKFYDMVKMVLPDDMNPGEFEKYAPDELWDDDPTKACLYALKNCPRINWDAYLERYGDIKNAGFEAYEHFIKFGVFERRKLISWHPLKEWSDRKQPLVSVLIASYNNAAYLSRTIESAISQTLEDIEIIVVDDASTDNSMDIIAKYAARDSRIKMIRSAENCGTYMTRKRGVLAATGIYIIFLDSDDYLDPNACLTAYNAIIKGFDIVQFGVNIVNNCRADASAIESSLKYLNNGSAREYSGRELVQGMYSTRELPWNLWVRIYLRELCVKAYNEIGDGCYLSTEDMLANMAISRVARSHYVIKDKLYFWNFGSGISTNGLPATKYKYMINLLQTTMRAISYAHQHEMNVNFNLLYEICCNWAINMWLKVVPDGDLDSCLRKVISIVGLDRFLHTLISQHGKNIVGVANKLKSTTLLKERQIKNIGVYCPSFRIGGIEVVTRNLIRELVQEGYKVTILKVMDAKTELPMPEGVDTMYIRNPSGDSKQHMEHCLSIYNALRENEIDLLIYTDTYHPSIIWDILVSRLLSIPVILNHHGNYVMSFMGRFGVSYRDRDAVFACADAVTCLSTEDELYFRSLGINAWRLPNPVHQWPYMYIGEPPQSVAILGRLEEPNKQIGESLRVIKEVVRAAPWVKAIFIGDFDSEKARQNFWTLAKKLGIYHNITVTGWTENPNHYLKQCGLLLTTSYWESFAMNMAEAQALGLPCVSYDLPIEQIKDNESILVVKQGDYERAAEEICSLLSDDKRWSRLSKIAHKMAARYDSLIYRKNLCELVQYFQYYSRIDNEAKNSYENIIRYATFYLSNKLPIK